MWDILFPIVGKLIDKVLPDTEAANKAKAELQMFKEKGELDALLGQLEINKEESKSASVFVAGWRPACGWVCGIALAYSAILEPILRFGATVGFGYSGSFPAIDSTLTMQILGGMLGIAGLRSWDKKNGTAS